MKSIYQQLKNLWQDFLGELAFVLLSIYVLYRWQLWAAIVMAILLTGMFHRRFLAAAREFIGHVNELFLGTPISGDIQRREGGIVPTIRHIGADLWNWVRKPFQPREPHNVSLLSHETGYKSVGLKRTADFFSKDPDSILGRKAETLRRLAAKSAVKYRERQEKRMRREMDNARKGQLCWTHLIGGFILSALMVVFFAGDIFITLQTILGMMGIDMPEALANNSILGSFEIMTAAVMVSSGILFGVYIFDLLGFIPIIPLHLLSVRIQRWLLGIMIFCGLFTFLVVGSLAAYRVISFQSSSGIEKMDMMESLDITSRLETYDMEYTNFSGELNSGCMPANTDMETKLNYISLIGTSLLAAMGTIMAFNGPIILLVFISLGFVGLIGGIFHLFGGLIRVIHRLLALLLSVIYMLLELILRIANILARPIIKLFSIHGTDDIDENEEIEPQPPQHGPDTPTREPVQTIIEPTDEVNSPQQEQNNQKDYEPSDAEWNPTVN